MGIIALCVLTCVSCSAVRLAKSLDPYLTGDGLGEWAYVYKIGGPKEITVWAMKQKDARKVSDARRALFSMLDSDDEQLAFAAMHGYVAIHLKLDTGWDGLFTSYKYGDLQYSIMKELEATYAWMAILSEENIVAKHFFFLIKPSNSEPKKFDLWHKQKIEYNVHWSDESEAEKWRIQP